MTEQGKQSNTDDIYPNPAAPDAIPPPWYRPPSGVTKGRPHLRNCIKAGLIISNEEGRRWFEQRFGVRLADHHRQDCNVPLRLNGLVQEAGIAVGCSFAPRRQESGVSDFLVITQTQYGQWMNDGPDNYEEVFQEELKPHPSVHEDKVKDRLENELGSWAPSSTSCMVTDSSL
ncbi:hypothetical protein AN958_11918 [Leucoagaricus sp. SymC.cos]|nr:hypothetical protein AN958_11918 [Leucoagaricus sp. SymC.cos]